MGVGRVAVLAGQSFPDQDFIDHEVAVQPDIGQEAFVGVVWILVELQVDVPVLQPGRDQAGDRLPLMGLPVGIVVGIGFGGIHADQAEAGGLVLPVNDEGIPIDDPKDPAGAERGQVDGPAGAEKIIVIKGLIKFFGQVFSLLPGQGFFFGKDQGGRLMPGAGRHRQVAVPGSLSLAAQGQGCQEA